MKELNYLVRWYRAGVKIEIQNLWIGYWIEWNKGGGSWVTDSGKQVRKEIVSEEGGETHRKW